MFRSLIDSKSEALTILFLTLVGSWVVQALQEAVVFLVGSQLEGMLVVSEQSVMSVGQVSQSTAL